MKKKYYYYYIRTSYTSFRSVPFFFFFYIFSCNNARAGTCARRCRFFIMRRASPRRHRQRHGGPVFRARPIGLVFSVLCRSLHGRRRRFSSPNRRFSYSVPTSYTYIILYYGILIITVSLLSVRQSGKKYMYKTAR